MMSDDYDWLEGGDADKLLTKAELAALFDFPSDEITKWLKGGCPSIGERNARRFNVGAVAHWLLDKGDLDKKRTEKAIAGLRELDLGERSEELIKVALVTRTLAEHVSALQNEFMTLPARCNLPPDLAEVVRGEVLRSINKFAKEIGDGL